LFVRIYSQVKAYAPVDPEVVFRAESRHFQPSSFRKWSEVTGKNPARFRSEYCFHVPLITGIIDLDIQLISIFLFSIFSSCRDNPVHLFDAYTGQVRASYKAFNHLVKHYICLKME